MAEREDFLQLGAECRKTLRISQGAISADKGVTKFVTKNIEQKRKWSEIAPENIMNNIRRLREQAGMDQRTLAQRAGLSAPDLCAVESGKRPLFPKWRRAIAEVLNHPADQLT